MSDTPKKEDRFRDTAKWLVDTLFDAKLMREDITRDQLNEAENAIADLMQGSWDSHIRCVALIEKMDKMTKARNS